MPKLLKSFGNLCSLLALFAVKFLSNGCILIYFVVKCEQSIVIISRVSSRPINNNY